MRDKKKISILENEVEQLRQSLHQEKQKALDLEKEISDLKSENDSLRQKNELLARNADGIVDVFKEELAELQSAKNKYLQLISELKSIRRRYGREMKGLLKELKSRI